MRQLATIFSSATIASCLLASSALSMSAIAQDPPPSTTGSGQDAGSTSRLRFLPPERSQDTKGETTAQGVGTQDATTQATGQNATPPANELKADGTVISTSAQSEQQSTGAAQQTQSRPAVGTLRLRGIEPGRSTIEQLRASWGEPLRAIETEPGRVQLAYEFPPFAAASMTITNGMVSQIVLPLEQSMTVGEAVAALQLGDVPQVIVPNEQGQPLGIAFPERGVVLSLDLNDASAVTQATVEPVSFHAFLMRAEATWHEDYTGALADVSTVMELDANQPQAYWIRAKILNALGRSEEALQSIREASRLVPDTPEYMLTEAAILIHQGHIQLAKDLAAETVRVSDQLPELKAQAMVFQGNLLRDDGPTGGRQAMDLHMQAIEAAKTMINDPRVTIRRAARDAYLDAHLAIAEDIASGTFRNQAEAAGQWIARAMALAEGAEPSRQREKSFQVASQALHVLARMQSPPNPEEWARQTLTFGRDLLANVQDPLCQQRISWELATALSAGVKIHRKRDEATDALQLAQLADKYFSDAGPDRGRDGREALQIGLFRFQAGSVEALLNDNHEAAVKWFEASRANFAQTPQRLTERMDSEYGQILVSMAVSYWELGQSEAALQLMTEGAGFMEAAVKGGRLESKALGAPYFNLAVMHRHLGKEQEAARFDELARNVGVETGAIR